ncbi:MAG: GNAT family N-acetyltransferase [Chloroflexota bacterium]
MTFNPSVAPGSPFVLETATWRDLNALRQVEKACFGRDSWPLFDLLGVLTFPNTVHIKATCDGQMIGFVGGDIRRNEDVGWVATIGVLPAYRGRGIGTALLEACEQALHTRWVRLCVRVSNETAIRLYRGAGYAQTGRWPAYYNDGEDAVVMEKALRGV